jgi:hypothetical protein
MNVQLVENSWLAAIAAKKLGRSKVAMVIGRRIYLHNTTVDQFVSNKRWVRHELKHVDQYRENGILGFLWKYMIESIRKGYYNNRFEIAARNAETDDNLLEVYSLKT